MRTLPIIYAIFITGIISAQSPCDSTFQVSINWVDQGSNIIVFQANTTLPANGLIWSFGDGNTGFGQTTQHMYAQPGSYYVCASAWYWDQQTQDTCWTESCTWISVAGPLPCDSTFFVTFGANPVLNNVFFAATSGGQADGYLWDFGDGTTGFGQSTQHQYAQPGQYFVCLVAYYVNTFTQDTCWTDECQWITVSGPPSPCDSLTAGFTPFSGGLGVNIANDVIDNSWSYSWDFGDGTTGWGPNPYHQYSSAGQYYICLLVWAWDPFTQDTCFADHCEWVTVGGGGGLCDSVSADLAFANTQGLEFEFNATVNSAGMIVMNTIWEFGDGTISTQEDTYHTFPDTGIYVVCFTLITWDQLTQDTCMFCTCQSVYVNDLNNGVGDADPMSSLSVVADAAGGALLIRGPGNSSRIALSVHTINGKMLLAKTIGPGNEERIPLPRFSSGVLLVRLRSDGHERTFRVAFP